MAYRSGIIPLNSALQVLEKKYLLEKVLSLFQHSGYLYYIDGYKKWNRSSQTTVIDTKRIALKSAIEWHWSHTSEMVGT